MPRPSPLALLAAVGSVAVACGDTAATPGFTTSPPTTTMPVSTSGSSSTSDSSSTSGSSGSGTSSSASGEDSTANASGSSTAGVSDVGQIPDFPNTPGCQGKIDFLFVISSEYEMALKQVQLQEAFPAFVDILKADFADFDYHVMVVDASLPFLNGCEGCYMCDWCGQGCTDFGGPPDYPCDEILEECVAVEGAGVTIAANFDASNTRCLPADGPRFITKDDPDLEGTFDCISKLGAGPKTPVAARRMLQALEPEILSKWGCNKGFLRPDALLAIVILQNGGDNITEGTPAQWYAKVVEAKKGNEDAIVTLVFSMDPDLCKGAWGNPLRVFAETAKHGHYASSCEPSYVPFMKDMAGTILELCSIFIPPQ